MRFYNSRFSLKDDIISIVYISLLEDVLKSAGYAPAKNCGLAQDLTDFRQRISPAEYMDTLERMLNPTVASGLGFEYGKLLDMSAASTVGQLMMSSRDIKQVFESFLNYYPLLSLSMQFDVSSENGCYRAEINRICPRETSNAVKWFLTECLLYCWLHQARYLSGKPLAFESVSITYERPPHWRMYKTMFGCDVEFGASTTSVTTDRDFMASRILTSNESVRALKERHCNVVLQKWQSRLSIEEQIVSTLMDTLPKTPSLECMAEKLNQSRSTLCRKLRDNNSSYQTIVDNFRQELAVDLLKNTDLTICEVTEKLGFSDDSNFRRAFKKWTGVTPSDIRGGDTPSAASAE
jgi:AraC-like DNA-binding protein